MVRLVSITQLLVFCWKTLQYLMCSGQSPESTAFTQPHLVSGLLDTPQLYLADLLMKTFFLLQRAYKVYLDLSSGLKR